MQVNAHKDCYIENNQDADPQPPTPHTPWSVLQPLKPAQDQPVPMDYFRSHQLNTKTPRVPCRFINQAPAMPEMSDERIYIRFIRSCHSPPPQPIILRLQLLD